MSRSRGASMVQASWPASVSIAGRVVAAILAVVAAWGLVVLAWFSQSAWHNARTGFDERIAEHQAYVHRTLAAALKAGDSTLLNAELDALQSHPDVVRIRLDAKNGGPALTRERAGEGAPGELVSHLQTLRQGNDELGEVRIDYSTYRAEQVARGQLRTLVAFVVALVLAAGATALAVARGVVRPITAMTRAVAAVADAEDVPPDAPRGPPEVAALGEGIRRMRDSLRDRLAAFAEHDQQVGEVIAERERIQVERDRLIGLIESTSDVIGMCDADLKVTYLNRAGREVLGLADRPVDGVAIPSLHPDWAGRLIAEEGLPVAMRDGTWTGETAIFDDQGRELPVSQAITCHRDAAGEVAYLSTIMRDVTERKRAEEALQRSESRLRQALEASGTGIFEHDHATDTLYWSPEMRRQFGFTADRVIGFPDLVVSIHPEDQAAFVQAAQRAHDPAGDGIFDVAFRHIRPDGSMRWASCRSLTTFAGEGSERRPLRTTGTSVDITERRSVAAALERSEERLRQAVRLTRSGTFEHDHLTDEVYFAPEARSTYGFGDDEPLTLQSIVSCLHPEDAAKVGLAIEQAHDPQGNGNFGVVHRIVRRDGEVRWVETRSITLFEGTGQARRKVRTVGAVVDITERHLADEALRRSEGRLTHALRAANTGIYDHDHASDVIYWSPEFRAIFGWPADTPVTLARFIESVLEEDRDRVRAAVARTHDPAGDGIYDAEYRIRRHDGALRWVQARGKTLFAGEGTDRHPVRTVGGAVDITERREAEEALRRSERRLSQAVQASNTGIFEHDLGSDEIYCSPEHRIMNGWSADEPVTIADIVAATLAEDRDDLGAAIRRSHDPAGDGALEIEHRIRRPDGTLRWLRVRAQTLFAGDGAARHPVRTVGGVIDITEPKRAGEQIRQLNAELEQRVRDRTAQLEATVRELESFSYSVSHDLRAPLRGIDGFSQALLEDFGDRLDDTGRDYLHRVRTNTQRMGQLIDDLLKLSRVTRAPLTPHPVDLGKLAQRALHQLEEQHPGHRPQTTVQPGPLVMGDPGLLLVVLENLLGNAWKYSSRRADARIEFGHLERDGQTVCFVRDNGVGFDMKYVSKLFGAFQRLHHHKDFEGTGIGLATVERIISRHGGRVWAEAEEGQGATFYFTLDRPGEALVADPAGIGDRSGP